jgi:hypothetical protein
VQHSFNQWRLYGMRIISLLIVISLAAACGSECPCADPSLSFSPVSFANNEADSIVIRRFIKNSNYLQLRDTLLADPGSIGFNRHGDTLEPAYYKPEILLSPVFDYELYFPATGSIFRIDNINTEHHTMHCGGFSMDKTFCINSLLSFRLNGQVIQPGPLTHTVYLSK